jgi:hypothetical protein
MNILMVNREMDIGGGNTFLRNMAAAFRQRGHKVYLISGKGETAKQQQQAFDDVIVKPMNMPWDHLWLKRFITDHKIDVVNAHALIQLSAVTRACNAVGTALIITLSAPFAEKRIARFLPHSHALMVMNEYQRRYFLQMETNPDRFFRSYWILDWDLYSKQSLPWRERKYDAIYCSRLSSTKAPLAIAFLQALGQMFSKRNDLRVCIIGNGRHLTKIQTAVDALRRITESDNISIITDVLDTAPYFGNAKVVSGGNYVSIEGLAAGAISIGAGYDGVFGMVTCSNLQDAAEQYFGDHITPITGVERKEEILVSQFERELRRAFQTEPAPELDLAARSLFRREDAILSLEKEFQLAVERARTNL